MTRSGSRTRSWPMAAGGLLVGAAATAGVLVALGWSGEASAPSSLTLPETADGMRTQQVVRGEHGNPEPVLDEIFAETADLLGQSHDGAVAVGQGYMDDNLEVQANVWAVGATRPGLWSSQESEALAEWRALGAPMQWVERDDGVECLVSPPMGVSAEGSVEDVEVNVLQCQLVDGDVTLLLEGHGFDAAGGAAILRDVAVNLERG